MHFSVLSVENALYSFLWILSRCIRCAPWRTSHYNNSSDAAPPFCCRYVVTYWKGKNQRFAIKCSHVVGLLPCLFEPFRFTCIPFAMGAVTLRGNGPFSVCGCKERLMSTPHHLSVMWMGRQWDPRWLLLSVTRPSSDLPWQGGQSPKTKLKESPVKGFRGQPQHPTNRPVL